jgi:hypothetical protein
MPLRRTNVLVLLTITFYIALALVQASTKQPNVKAELAPSSNKILSIIGTVIEPKQSPELLNIAAENLRLEQERIRIENENIAAAKAKESENKINLLKSNAKNLNTDGLLVGRRMFDAIAWQTDDKEAEWAALYQLWMEESGWTALDANGEPHGLRGTSLANGRPCGIPQALPCSKIPNPYSVESQIEWGLSYIKRRYTTPREAYKQKQRVNWY